MRGGSDVEGDTGPDQEMSDEEEEDEEEEDEDDGKDLWVQCEGACEKWFIVPREFVEEVEQKQNDVWVCSMASWKAGGGCPLPSDQK